MALDILNLDQQSAELARPYRDTYLPKVRVPSPRVGVHTYRAKSKALTINYSSVVEVV